MVSEPRFIDTPQVLSACRITLPTDEVESSVKTILLKIGWIDLSSFDFTPYPDAILLLPLRALSFLSYLCFPSLVSYEGWTTLCQNPNRFDLRKASTSSSTGVTILVSGVDKISTTTEDPIVEPLSSRSTTRISGRDSLLVVSVVTAQEIHLFR